MRGRGEGIAFLLVAAIIALAVFWKKLFPSAAAASTLTTSPARTSSTGAVAYPVYGPTQAQLGSTLSVRDPGFVGPTLVEAGLAGNTVAESNALVQTYANALTASDLLAINDASYGAITD